MACGCSPATATISLHVSRWQYRKGKLAKLVRGAHPGNVVRAVWLKKKNSAAQDGGAYLYFEDEGEDDEEPVLVFRVSRRSCLQRGAAIDF
jgi:hypothetical protein